MIYVDPLFKIDLFHFLFQTTNAEVYRDLSHRKTFRFVFDEQHFIAKVHYGIGWKEILKNICCGKIPVCNALTEWEALNLTHDLNLNVPQPIAVGVRGNNPATQKSFIVMKALEEAIDLETLSQKKPNIFLKNKNYFIRRVAEMTKTLHENNIFHLDLYLCHFLWKPKNKCVYLIDWHRAKINPLFKQRWQIKDLSALYFSSLDMNLTKKDYALFKKIYMKDRFKHLDQNFWKKVENKALKLQKRLAGRCPDVARTSS